MADTLQNIGTLPTRALTDSSTRNLLLFSGEEQALLSPSDMFSTHFPLPRNDPLQRVYEGTAASDVLAGTPLFFRQNGGLDSPNNQASFKEAFYGICIRDARQGETVFCLHKGACVLRLQSRLAPKARWRGVPYLLMRIDKNPPYIVHGNAATNSSAAFTFAGTYTNGVVRYIGFCMSNFDDTSNLVRCFVDFNYAVIPASDVVITTERRAPNASGKSFGSAIEDFTLA